MGCGTSEEDGPQPANPSGNNMIPAQSQNQRPNSHPAMRSNRRPNAGGLPEGSNDILSGPESQLRELESGVVTR